MGLCLHCNKWIKQPEGKREKLFCNNTCRSNYWYSKNKKGKSLINQSSKIHIPPKLPSTFEKDEPLSFEKLKSEISYNEAQSLITNATSSFELQNAWQQINTKKDWPSWQMRELTKLKENQRTKIDF